MKHTDIMDQIGSKLISNEKTRARTLARLGPDEEPPKFLGTSIKNLIQSNYRYKRHLRAFYHTGEDGDYGIEIKRIDLNETLLWLTSYGHIYLHYKPWCITYHFYNEFLPDHMQIKKRGATYVLGDKWLLDPIKGHSDIHLDYKGNLSAGINVAELDLSKEARKRSRTIIDTAVKRFEGQVKLLSNPVLKTKIRRLTKLQAERDNQFMQNIRSIAQQRADFNEVLAAVLSIRGVVSLEASALSKETRRSLENYRLLFQQRNN